MTSITIRRRARLGTALAALALSLGSVAVATPAAAGQRAGTFKPSGQVLLSTGEGQMVTLPSSVSDVWTSNPAVADVYVTNPRQINLFGKEAGEATVIATSSSGAVVYSTNVRVSQNITSVDEMLRAAMPGSNIRIMNVGQLAVLTGTVSSPDESAQAAQLVSAMLNPGVDMSKDSATCKICVINRLSTATPLQVNLKVRIAEVSRSLVKQIGVNLLSRDGTSGFQFGIGQGSPGTFGSPAPADGSAAAIPKGFNSIAGGTTLGFAGKLLGLDILSTLDLSETDGLVTTLAEPNLTALSGETASFLAGGEFPIPVSQSLGAVTIEYKQYGVGLAFTPIVLADGRISMRVRPEVSELSNEGSIKLNGFNVPALTTRRAETTVELGSGQSFMIAGLLRNANTNDISKAPFLGDLPILGALFRSTKYRRAETELVIIVTPYLVRPVSNQLALPTNGYRSPTSGDMVLEGQTYRGVSGPAAVGPAPAPAMTGTATTATASPGFKL
jgi:pilus assembly protein CpaC